MLIHRTGTRFIARLLIGVLATAQIAWAAYACPVIPAYSMGVQGNGAVAGASALTDMRVDVLPTESGHTDLAGANLCVTHCRFGEQNADSSPAPTPMVALLVGYFALPLMAQVAGHAAPLAMANRPPPLVDPPHAILHCCLRI